MVVSLFAEFRGRDDHRCSVDGHSCTSECICHCDYCCYCLLCDLVCWSLSVTEFDEYRPLGIGCDDDLVKNLDRYAMRMVAVCSMRLLWS